MKRLMGLVLAASMLTMLGGCVYGPGYYQRPGVAYDDGTSVGGANVGDYDYAYAPGYYAPGYYAGYYDPWCCYGYGYGPFLGFGFYCNYYFHGHGGFRGGPGHGGGPHGGPHGGGSNGNHSGH
jgi:hypothetical protein